jgi:hypothetical protein
MTVHTREQVQAHGLALGYTHVGTLAGPVPIAQWRARRSAPCFFE